MPDVIAPPRWSEISADPSFEELSPDRKLVMFDRWLGDTTRYSSTLPDWKDESESFLKKAGAKLAEYEKAAGMDATQARIKIADDRRSEFEKTNGAIAAPEQMDTFLQTLPGDMRRAYSFTNEDAFHSTLRALPDPESRKQFAFARESYLSKPEAEGVLATMGRIIATKEIPALGNLGGSIVGGLAAGAVATPESAGVLTVPAAIVGAGAGGIGGEALVEAIQNKAMGAPFAEQNRAQIEANAKAHPFATQMAEAVPLVTKLFGTKMGELGNVVKDATGKVLGKSMTGAGEKAMVEAAEQGTRYAAPMAERVVHGAAGFARADAGAEAARQVDSGDFDAKKLADAYARGAVAGTAVGVLPAAAPLTAEGFFPVAKELLFQGTKRGVMDSTAMTIGNAMYDYAVHGKDINFADLAESSAAGVPAFALQNIIMGAMHKMPMPRFGGKSPAEVHLEADNLAIDEKLQQDRQKADNIANAGAPATAEELLRQSEESAEKSRLDAEAKFSAPSVPFRRDASVMFPGMESGLTERAEVPDGNLAQELGLGKKPAPLNIDAFREQLAQTRNPEPVTGRRLPGTKSENAPTPESSSLPGTPRPETSDLPADRTVPPAEPVASPQADSLPAGPVPGQDVVNPAPATSPEIPAELPSTAENAARVGPETTGNAPQATGNADSLPVEPLNKAPEPVNIDAFRDHLAKAPATTPRPSGDTDAFQAAMAQSKAVSKIKPSKFVADDAAKGAGEQGQTKGAFQRLLTHVEETGVVPTLKEVLDVMMPEARRKKANGHPNESAVRDYLKALRAYAEERFPTRELGEGGAASRQFTNDPATTATQMDHSLEPIEVPREMLDKLNPGIKIRREGEKYVVASAIHPEHGEISEQGQLQEAEAATKGQKRQANTLPPLENPASKPYQDMKEALEKLTPEQARNVSELVALAADAANVAAKSELKSRGVQHLDADRLSQYLTTAVAAIAAKYGNRLPSMDAVRTTLRTENGGVEPSASDVVNRVFSDYFSTSRSNYFKLRATDYLRALHKDVNTHFASLDAPAGEGGSTLGDFAASTAGGKTNKEAAAQLRAEVKTDKAVDDIGAEPERGGQDRISEEIEATRPDDTATDNEPAQHGLVENAAVEGAEPESRETSSRPKGDRETGLQAITSLVDNGRIKTQDEVKTLWKLVMGAEVPENAETQRLREMLNGRKQDILMGEAPAPGRSAFQDALLKLNITLPELMALTPEAIQLPRRNPSPKNSLLFSPAQIDALNKVPVTTESLREVVVAAQKEIADNFPGVELNVSPSDHPDAGIMWVDHNDPSRVHLDPVRLSQSVSIYEGQGHSREEAIRMVVSEEGTHTLGVKAVAMPEAVELGAAWSQGATGEASARVYLGPNASKEQLDAYLGRTGTAEEKASAHYRMAQEYLRQVYQRLTLGKTTEDLNVPTKPGALNAIATYLRTVANKLKARLEIAADPKLADAIDRMKQEAQVRETQAGLLKAPVVSSTEAPSQKGIDSPLYTAAPHAVKEEDPVALTQALKRARTEMHPVLSEVLKDKTHARQSLDATEKEAVGMVDHIVNNGGDLDDVAYVLDNTKVSPNVATAARAELSRRAELAYLTLIKSVENCEASPDVIQLADHYRRLTEEQTLKTAQELNRAAQTTSVAGRVANRILAGSVIRKVADYVKPIKDAQDEHMGKDPGAQAAVGAIRGDRPALVEGTLKKVEKLLKKAVGLDDKQLTFEFFENLRKDYEKAIEDSKREGADPNKSVTDLIAEAIAKRMVKDLAPKKVSEASEAKEPEPFLKVLEDQVSRKVAAELRRVLEEKVEKTKLTDAEVVTRFIRDMDNVSLVEKAFNESRAEMLASEEITPEQKAKLDKATFDFGAIRSAQEVVKRFVNMRTTVQKHLNDQRATRQTLINELTKTVSTENNLNRDQVEAVAKAIGDTFDALAKAEAHKQLLALSREKGSRVKVPGIPKLLKLANLGAFDKAETYNAIAKANPGMKLPVVDEAFVKHLRDATMRIQEMPDGEPRDLATQRLEAEIKMRHNDNLQGRDKLRYYLGDVAPSVWQASVLSGPPTPMVDMVSTQTNMVIQSLSQAFGYQMKALGEGVSLKKSFNFYGVILDAWARSLAGTKSGLTGSAINEMQHGFLTGMTKFRTEKGETFRSLDMHGWIKDPKTPKEFFNNFLSIYRIVGRVMTAGDGFNAATANEISQQHFVLQSALRNGWDVAETLKDAFDPSVNVRESINRQVEEEAAKGFLGTGRDLVLAKRRRVLALVEARREELFPGVMQEGRKSAERLTFQNEPHGMPGLLFDGLVGGLGRTFPPMKFFTSFMRTMSNLVNVSIDFTPVGYFRAINLSASSLLPKGDRYQREKIERGSTEYWAKMAQATVGTTIAFALGSLVAQGFEDEDKKKVPFIRVFGSGPQNAGMRQQMLESGWQPNTIEFNAGGKPLRVRYTDFPAASLLLAAFGEASDQVRYYKNQDLTKWEKVGLYSMGAVTAIMDKRLLQGVSGIFEVLKNRDLRGVSAVRSLVGGVVGGFTNPQLLRWARKTFGVDSEGKVPKLDMASMEGWVASLVPGSLGYNKTALNTLGQEVKMNWWAATTDRIGVFNSMTENPQIKPFVDAGLFLPNPSQSTPITIGDKVIPLSRNHDIFRAFVKYRGEALQKRLTPDFIERITKFPDKERAQSFLNGELAAEVRAYGQARVIDDIRKGVLKPEFIRPPKKQDLQGAE